ncbi:DndE family protein [Elioraea sp.]|uniref:DndE family protein n=1 Tax=Elioraea sp. TaxID=2185103 RepID=UPI0021DC1CD1|nr:DndE family protein [Elioraea sp.]GIX11305.1 MAG: hypothetical protein KatS3mg116_3015 [Elioraea sp.]
MTEPITESGVGLDQIATATFRASAEADLAAQRLKDALGFGAFNVPARLAIARSLAVPDRPEPVQGEPGRAIKGDTLLGTGADLAAWVSLLVEYEGKAPETIPEFQGWVRAHWTRGLALLATTLDQAGGDAGEFWRIISQAALPEGPPRPGGDREPVESGERTPLAIPVGEVAEDIANGQQVGWSLNAPGGSPHAAFMGGVGSGKTRTATFMLRAIRRHAPVPLIAFDFKGDMTDDKNALDRAFGATVIAPPHEAIPLDVLAIADRSPTGIALAAQRLRDSLATLKGAGFGTVQKGLLGDAAELALRTRTPCRLSDVRDALKHAYAQQNRREDGAIATLDDLCRFDLFRPDLAPAEFFRRSWIIRLTADLPELVKVSVVTLLTDALDRHLNSLPDAPTDGAGNRALRALCVIDEAHRILGNSLPGLSGLIRLSRSKGGSVMLISQGPDDFSGEDDEFLNEMGLVVAFRTNADARAVRRILGPGANLAMLEKGQAWVKVGAEPAPRRVIAWR